MDANDESSRAMPDNAIPPATEIPEMPKPAVAEQRALGAPGLPFLLIAPLVLVAGIVLMVIGGGLTGGAAAALVLPGVLVVVADVVMLRGLTQVAPGEARVLQLFGRYRGTIREDGLRWVNPFTSRRRISTRLRNHETEVLKVNDAYGNPIEISCVVVWQVADTAQAVFEVDDFVNFVSIQTDTAVRHIATHYAYDAHGAEELSLRENAEVITEQLSA
jgi:regulator of protease activity HflC (stomatin/prohibitin superfamily)